MVERWLEFFLTGAFGGCCYLQRRRKMTSLQSDNPDLYLLPVEMRSLLSWNLQPLPALCCLLDPQEITAHENVLELRV